MKIINQRRPVRACTVFLLSTITMKLLFYIKINKSTANLTDILQKLDYVSLYTF